MKVSIWDILSIVGLLALIGMVLLFGSILINPTSPFNPFPPPALPPTIELPSATPTLRSLPATWTPTVNALVQSTLASTSTPQPTATGFIVATWTASPTFTPVATATSTPGPNQSRLISQNPADGARLSHGQDFDMVWKVENTGTNTWDRDDYKLVYSSGQKTQKSDEYAFREDVSPGERYDCIVDMVAPSETGNYSLTWKITGEGGKTIQILTFTFRVQ